MAKHIQTQQERIDNLKDQIASMCVHYNGVGNNQCRAGITYKNVGTIDPCALPCLQLGGHCANSKFVSAEDAEKKAKEKLALIPEMNAREDVFNYQLRTGRLHGEIPCRCGGTLKYIVQKTGLLANCNLCGIKIKPH